MVAGGRQVHQFLGLAGERGGTLLVIEAQHRIMVGDVELAVAPGDARGRGQVAAQRMPLLGDPVAVGVAQQDQLVR